MFGAAPCCYGRRKLPRVRERAITGLVLLLAALALVFLASPDVAFFAVLVLGLGSGLELARLVAPRPDAGLAFATACGCALIAVALTPFLATLSVVSGCVLLLASPYRSWSATLGGIAWVGGGLAGLRALASSHPANGVLDPHPIILMLLLPVWAGDTFAYFGGRAFGRRPLIPKVSPKKTVEGAACGLIGALLLSVAVGAWFGIPLGRALTVGLAVGGLGPAGDFLESLLKRRAGVKDSGTLLPGHGGLLDRLDSLLLAAPVATLILSIGEKN